MKYIYKYGLSLLLLTSMTMAISLTTTKPGYTSLTEVSVNINGSLSGNQDWIGIYQQGKSNDWSNVLAWSWVDSTVNNLSIDTMNHEFAFLFNGNLEARLFFNNSYTPEASDSFYITDSSLPNLIIDNPIYNEGDTATVFVNTILSGNQDWVGIFEKDAANTWGNVIAWNWAPNNGSVTLDKVATTAKDMPAGDYDVRLFFNNSFNVEERTNFTVLANNPIRTTKAEYTVNESVQVEISTTLSGDRDWVGIYPKDSDNSWGNVIAWNWVPNNGTITLNKGVKNMPAGDYEARLFYKNSYNLENKVEFSVNGGAYVYGSEGAHLDKVKVDNSNEKYIVYYPEGHVQNAPLVLFVGYENTIKGASDNFRLEGMMKYVASLGCYVIGHKQINGNNSDKLNTEIRRTYFIDAVNEAKAKGVDTSKLGIVGKSAGGMHAYALMEYFKTQNYGTDKRFIIDVIGYLPIGMNKEQLEGLNINSLILHYGMKNNNYNGVQTKYPQDPRVLLTVAHILKHGDNKVGFIPIKTDIHSYEKGNYDTFKTKNDLMKHIDAMIKYELFNENGQYNNASDILFSGYEQTRNKTIQDTIAHLDENESEAQSEVIYYEPVYDTRTPCNESYNNINYCQDYK